MAMRHSFIANTTINLRQSFRANKMLLCVNLDLGKLIFLYVLVVWDMRDFSLIEALNESRLPFYFLLF